MSRAVTRAPSVAAVTAASTDIAAEFKNAFSRQVRDNLPQNMP